MGFPLGIGAELGVKRFWHSQKKSASPYSWARPSEKARQRALNVEPRALYVARALFSMPRQEKMPEGQRECPEWDLADQRRRAA